MCSTPCRSGSWRACWRATSWRSPTCARRRFRAAPTGRIVMVARFFVSRLGFGAMMTAKALWSPVALGVHALIVDADGKVLLARHSYMKGWSLPGGGVGRGEPPPTALRRELREEIGSVSSAEPELIGMLSRRAGWATNVVLLYRLSNARVDFTPNFEVR